MCLKGERPKINFKTLKSIKTQDDNSFISCVSVDMQILNKKGGRWWCRCWWRSWCRVVGGVWVGGDTEVCQIRLEVNYQSCSGPSLGQSSISQQHHNTTNTQHSKQQQIYFILRIWDSVKLEACVYWAAPCVTHNNLHVHCFTIEKHPLIQFNKWKITNFFF